MSFHFKVRRSFSENVVYEFPYLGRIVDFTVPTSGIYKIEAWGARGGSENSTTGPLGAYSKSFVSLNKGEIIQILVGEKGYRGSTHSSWTHCGGGGGGTFIAKGSTPLCVAGGGGGFAYTNSYNSVVQSHACGQATQLSAIIGTSQASLKMGGKGGANAAGGGGFEGNGLDGSPLGKGGISFYNFGTKQIQGTYGNYGYGGFGGGGSRHGECGYGAGGGGYTGGSAVVNDNSQGGGGGSYFEGNLSSEALSYAISGCDSNIPPNPGTNGNGFAVLTLLKPLSNDVRAKECNYCYQIQFLWTLYSTFISQ
jgi:hypothetical protein